jgi:hypothetical protein
LISIVDIDVAVARPPRDFAIGLRLHLQRPQIAISSGSLLLDPDELVT